LAVTDVRLRAGMPLRDLGGHLRPQLERDVVVALLVRQPLVVEVLAEAGADLERRRERRGCVLHDVAVVELLDDAVLLRQLLVPGVHEVVADALLLRRERRERLRPLRRRRRHEALSTCFGSGFCSGFAATSRSTMYFGRRFTSS